MISYTETDSPVGRLLLAGDESAVRRIHFMNGSEESPPSQEWRNARSPLLKEALRQLEAYFAGELRDFTLELAPEGTPFQLAVWRRLQEIPYGATISYGELARRVGNPKASRAVGLANGANPIPIVIPCHRVIGASGKLTGYGGGLPIKRTLLDIESAERRLAVKTANAARTG